MDGADSWVEISSQPSSSSLSSVADEIVTTGLRVQQPPTTRRLRRLRPGAPSHLNVISRANSTGGTSSQEEYEESESESDQVMTSSNEALPVDLAKRRERPGPAPQSSASDVTDDEDENRTAVNYPINHEQCFTPLPNAFTHPPSSHAARHVSQPVPGSYFPRTAERPAPRPSTRHSYPSQLEPRAQHSPYNVISPSYNAAADHEAALRASLSTLLSCAAAARGLPKPKQASSNAPRPASARVEPSTLRMVPESALNGTSPPAVPLFEEPAFNPTIRRTSISTSASADSRRVQSSKQEAKRKATATTGRTSSKDRRAVKKARRSGSAYGYDELFVSPTLLTWVVSAGVVVVLSALSFSAGYSMGKEAGRLEVGAGSAAEAGSCAREASRTGLGLRKLRFSSVAKSVGVGA
ncbi:hypothetical protein MBLNU459_g3056t1 [Dothideomycetes sp. NU459]